MANTIERYQMRPITEKNWSEDEKRIINSRIKLISNTVNTMIEERAQDGFPQEFCMEAARRFDFSMRKNNNLETENWIKRFSGKEEEDRQNIKKFFDKKLHNTVSHLWELERTHQSERYQKMKNGRELQKIASQYGTDLGTLRDYSSLLAEDVAWECFTTYRDERTKKHEQKTGRRLDPSVANERALSDMMQYIDNTISKMDKIRKKKEYETPYQLYMGNESEKVSDTIQKTYEALKEQKFDQEVIDNTLQHMKSNLKEEKYNIYKNLYPDFNTEQTVEMMIYQDMSKSINDCMLLKSNELQDYVKETRNVEKFPTYQAQLLINMKNVSIPQEKSHKSLFTEFENQDNFETQTTYRMKLMKDEDNKYDKQFHFYAQPFSKDMEAEVLKIQDHFRGKNCREISNAELPSMPVLYDYDGDKVMFVSKEQWSSYVEKSNENCYATVENYQICDMNKIVIIDRDCKVEVLEPQIDSIEGKKYWKYFKKNTELTKELNKGKVFKNKEEKVTQIEETDITEKNERTDTEKEVPETDVRKKDTESTIGEQDYTSAYDAAFKEMSDEDLFALYGNGEIDQDMYDFDMEM